MGNQDKSFVYRGKEYKSLRDCCKKLGFVYPSIFCYKRKYRCTAEEAIDYFANKQGGFNAVTYKNQDDKNLLELCMQLGLKLSEVNSVKYMYNCSAEQAINYVLKYQRNPNASIEFMGEHYDSVKELCEDYELDYQKILKWSKEKSTITGLIAPCAITSKKRLRQWSSPVVYKGKQYDNYKQLGESLGVKGSNIFHYVYSEKMKVREAVDYAKGQI